MSNAITQTLEMLEAAQEAAIHSAALLDAGKTADFSVAANSLSDFFVAVGHVSAQQTQLNKTTKLDIAVDSLKYSLSNIIRLAESGDVAKAAHKAEFELYPFTKSLYAEYYFWTSIFPERKKWEHYWKTEMPKLYANQYIDESIARGSYKYDLSIIVTGYNKLEYTRQCVDSLLANIPGGVKHELILFNHGSSDGTKEYFESINPAKQIDVKINGSIYDAHFRIVEGEYWICISNDTIITKNAIDNMLRSMREHEDYGWIVPTTPNVSNLQQIPCHFANVEEMLAFAERNNVYDPYRHEVRTRLCNPISFFRSGTSLSSDGTNFAGCHFTGGDVQIMSFPDDTISMLFRRRGLKNILAKDAFCFHFGSVTIKDDVGRKNIDEAAGYARGRLEFKNAFGIDPWGTGFCYDYNLFIESDFDCKFEGPIEILGINCGMGSNPLKIKELYKEKRHNLDVTLTNITDDEAYLLDTQGISDVAAVVTRFGDIFTGVRDKLYHYIVFEDMFSTRQKAATPRDINSYCKYLVPGGEFLVKQPINPQSLASQGFADVRTVGPWTIVVKGQHNVGL